MSTLSPIVYPREYFAAMIYWAFSIFRIKKISLLESIHEFTDIYGSLTEEPWDKRFESRLWSEYISTVKDSDEPERIIDTLYNLYLQQDHSVYSNKLQISQDLQVLSDRATCGPLILAFDDYNRARESVRVHFNPTREYKSWLSSDRYPELEEAFRKLLVHSKNHYSDAKYFTSSTWLNNVPNFRRLFPESFNNLMKNTGGGSYLGLWGQFIKSNGEGNSDRLNEFVMKLQSAKTMEDAIDAIPLKVLEAIGPIEDFYSKYNIN